MGKIAINNGDWQDTKNENNTKHRGEGCATENNNTDQLRKIKDLIEAFLQEKYKCIKGQLANESERERPVVDPNGPESGPATLGSPIGPGVIGNNSGGEGYAGDSNIFVGLPDEDAVKLSKDINDLKESEVKENVKNNNC